MARTSRLLTLLQLLRGRTRPVTAATLAAELAVSERTLYRDIAELAALGAPIDGAAGLGYILRPGLFLPPLMLAEEETEAILLGLRYVEQRGDDTLGNAARAALAKVAEVLSPTAQEALRNPVSLPGPPRRGFPDNAVGLATFRAAIKAQSKLDIAYIDGSGTRSERIVWPLALGFMDEARILVAWCELRQDYRTFRTDRIAAARHIEQRYPGRRAAHLKAWRVRAEAGQTE